MTLDNFKETRRESITVGYFFESNKDRLMMTSANGEVGFEKVIRDRSIHRPGLALAGYVELFTYDRVQVVGRYQVRMGESPLDEHVVDRTHDCQQQGAHGGKADDPPQHDLARPHRLGDHRV